MRIYAFVNIIYVHNFPIDYSFLNASSVYDIKPVIKKFIYLS